MRVSQISFFDQIGFGRQKTAWGCRTEGVLRMTFFTFFPGEDQLVKFLARGCVAYWVRVGLVVKNGLAAVVRRVFAIFSGLFFRHRLREFEGDLLKLPSSSFHVLLFSAFSSWVWGQCALNPFFGFFTRTLFSSEKGLFLCIYLCLPFFLLGFIHCSFSLSLSLSCFLLFLSLLFCF